MSKFPKWWDSTITVFTKYENPTTHQISWYKTVLSNCFWRYRHERVFVGETAITTNETVCRIPKQDNFIDKYQWLSLADTAKPAYFTIGAGDIILLGNISDTISEYTSGQRASDILAKHKALRGGMTVEQATVDTGTGRGTEHYYITGI